MTEHLARLPDGTVKQVNPFTGTQVWTLPSRGRRPWDSGRPAARPLDPLERERWCAFCPGRKLDTTPEIARLVREGDGWRAAHVATAEELDSSVAEFRLVPNLFEILSYDYWRLVHGFRPTPAMDARRTAYLSTPLGREHVTRLARLRRWAEGVPVDQLTARSFEDDVAEAASFFAGNHHVVIARRHFVDGAQDDSQLAGSGTLTPEEHWKYVEFTIAALESLYRDNPFARYVAVFQNWLRPAGASFDHLHKQLVAIDELGTQAQREMERLRDEPDLYARWGPRYAAEQGLVVARTERAVAFAGVGHVYPSLEVHCLDPVGTPWDLDVESVRDVADLVHACHAATGADIPTNEEWHHRPPSVDLPIPLRVVLKWRISTLAGFEGGTRIYVNTVDPWTVRDRVCARLQGLRADGAISDRVILTAGPPPQRKDMSSVTSARAISRRSRR
ncbi:MAG TPA: DUF4921 family protein [Intrasporangium sp.]|uniref:DUF4921 family protein n=1 Tax=Intrasporangium sp. TaxID=1925024 RepID=UPI002D78A42A|nr:DUF4921 family protein [Intrasporangium sp.]HET7398832.1 DUF4921 family protein [Intrasporangium sp.]